MANAVWSLHLTTGSPISICLCAVLAAVTTVSQGLYDVEVRPGAISPSTINTFATGDSGLGKSPAYLRAFELINDFDKTQAKAQAKDLSDHERALRLWNLVRRDIERRFEMTLRNPRKGKSTTEERRKSQLAIEEELAMHDACKPKLRTRARILIKDATRQAIPKHLHEVYPYITVGADEGAVVTGSDALGNTPMFSMMYDYGSWSADRVGRGRIDLIDCRVAIHVMETHENWSRFFSSANGQKAFEGGFFNRCLHVTENFPDKIQPRPIVEIDPDWLGFFDRRVRTLLEKLDIDGIPVPEVVTLTAAARARMEWFKAKLIDAMGKGERFERMRGYASKAPEMCTRLAAQLHILEGRGGSIQLATVDAAIKLMSWFMQQFREKFCPRSQLEEDVQMLRNYFDEHVGRRYKSAYLNGPVLSRFMPKPLRGRFWPALRAMHEAKLLTLHGEPKKTWSVTLTSWFPITVAFDPQLQSGPGRFRWKGDFEPQEPLVEQSRDTRVQGFELWPGTFLPDAPDAPSAATSEVTAAGLGLFGYDVAE